MRIAGLVLLLASTLLGSGFAREDKRPQVEAMFARAQALLRPGQTSGGGPGGGPYTLRGHFRLVISNQPVEGTLLEVVSEAAQAWRREISFPGYNEVVVRNGDRKWVHRSAAFTPLRVRDLLAVLQPHLKIDEKEKVERIREETVGTAQARCVELRTKFQSREVCMDAATGLPVRTKSPRDSPDQVEYQGYASAGGREFPAKVRLTEKDKVVAEFWLDSLSTDLPDKSLFDPLPEAVVWPVCDNLKLPVPVSTPDPYYPDVELHKQVQGVVGLQVVIDVQGRVRDMVVIRSVTLRFNEESQAAVSKWRFKPAMCGSTPVPYEMVIEVSFRIGG